MNKQEIWVRIKLIVIFIGTVLITIIGTAVLCAAQDAYQFSINKEGLSTKKQILLEIKSDKEIWFWTSKKNVEKFYKVGKSFSGADIWVDTNNKNIVCQDREGLRIFAVTDKKAFYYVIPNKKVQQ